MRSHRNASAFCCIRIPAAFPQERHAAQHDDPAQQGKARTSLPEGIADSTHQRTCGNHQQAVCHAVHADEGGPLVTGDGIVQLLALVEQIDLQHTLHQHHAQDAAPGRRSTHQQSAHTAEQGTGCVEPPHGTASHPAADLSARNAGQTAQQQGKEEQLCGPAQLNEPLLQKHLGQVTGHADEGAGCDKLHRHWAGAQDMQAVLHQLAELFGQSVQRVLFPAGLRLSDDGLRK